MNIFQKLFSLHFGDCKNEVKQLKIELACIENDRNRYKDLLAIEKGAFARQHVELTTVKQRNAALNEQILVLVLDKNSLTQKLNKSLDINKEFLQQELLFLES